MLELCEEAEQLGVAEDSVFVRGQSANSVGVALLALERPDDADNPVRLVISAACPANLWEAFEKRFGVKIWEAYGAVDGGGVIIMNAGNAPVGSVGRAFMEIESQAFRMSGE